MVAFVAEKTEKNFVVSLISFVLLLFGTSMKSRDRAFSIVVEFLCKFLPAPVTGDLGFLKLIAPLLPTASR